MPFSKSSKSLPDWLVKQPIAHRGLHDIERGVAENSLAAFRHALNAGFAIELDVRLSKDKQAVVMHDRDLQRTSDDPRKITEVPLSELQGLKLEGTTDHIPSLQEVLELVAGKVPLVVELKPADNKAEMTRIVCDLLSSYEGPFSVQTFDPFILLQIKKLYPHYIRGQLGMDKPPAHLTPFKKRLIRNMYLNFLTQPDYIGYDVLGLSTRVKNAAHRHHRPLLAWTVDTEQALNKARDYADNIIFEKLPVERLSVAPVENSPR